MNKLTVADVDFKGRKVLVRVDYNVPLDADCNITDDRRIRASLPTLTKILDDGGRVIACSHLGRPKGKRVDNMSLRPAALRLSELLDREVMFADDCVGEIPAAVVSEMKDGDCLLLENLRFHEEETKNDARWF